MQTNVLYYGDNLDILPYGPSGRHHIPDESVDLIYLDPPFNSQATYNVLFHEESGAVSHARIEAFEPAASAFYGNDFWKKRYPRVQILTVAEVLDGKKPDMPWGGSPFAKAPIQREQAEQERLV